jgi:hypothetical protein
MLYLLCIPRYCIEENCEEKFSQKIKIRMKIHIITIKAININELFEVTFETKY